MADRAFGVAAGLDPEVAAPLASRCRQLGYSSMWSNDHPGALGLETLAVFAEAAPELELGVAVMALDRHAPTAIAGHVDRLGLDRDRLWIGVGAGFSERPLTRMRQALPELRDALGGIRLVLAAMGPKMCALAGSAYDGAFFNWMTPAFAADARRHVEAGAAEAGREPPPVFGYVRAAVGEDAAARLAKEEAFYRDLHDGYRNHFARLGAPEGTVGVAAPGRGGGPDRAGRVRRGARRHGRPRARERERRGDDGAGGGRGAALVRRQLGVPVAERPERGPELALRRLGVERVVDVRHVEGVDRRRQLLDLARARRQPCGPSGISSSFRHSSARLAHDDDAARLHDRDLLDHPLDALAGGERSGRTTGHLTQRVP